MSSQTTRRAVHKHKNAQTSKPTLDVQHNAFMNKLQDIESEKEGLERSLCEITQKISQLEADLVSLDDLNEREALVDDIIKHKDERLRLRDQLAVITDAYDPEKYFTTTGDVLFQYYEILENNSSEKKKPIQPVQASANFGIMKYFSHDSNSTHASPRVSQEHARVTPITEEKTRGALLDKYLKLTSPDYVPDNAYTNPNAHMAIQGPHDTCNFCGSKSLMTLVNDGCVCCSQCHAIEYIVIDHDKPSYRDPPKEVSFYAYKRTNHLNEWLSQVQGKETTEIPEEVYDRILVEIKKQKITNMAQITQKKIREILRKLQINKYEHIPHIVSRLTGKPMLQMPPELEEKIRTMFKQIQTPFLKHSPANRKNFLSYSYTIRKILEILGEYEYMKQFNSLKSRDKVAAQDNIWRAICTELGWDYFPSI